MHDRAPSGNPCVRVRFRRPYPGSLPLNVLRQLKLGSSGCWRRHSNPRAKKNKKDILFNPRGQLEFKSVLRGHSNLTPQNRIHATYDGPATDKEVGLAGRRPRATVASRRHTAECLQIRPLDPPKKGTSQLKDIQKQLSVSRLARSAKFTGTLDQGVSPGEDSINGTAQSSPVRLTC